MLKFIYAMKSLSKILHIKIIRYLREWHRKLGIIAALFLIFLSVSGIALNHTSMLSLAHRPIQNTWLLDHYGISPPSIVHFYSDNSLIITDNLVWLGEQLLLESTNDIIGITPITINEQQAIAVVSRNQLYFYTEKGELIDQLGDESNFPIGANALALTNDMLVIKSAFATMRYNNDTFLFEKVNQKIKHQWILPNKVDKQVISAAKLNYRSQYLTVERIVLDTHSGRIFGFFGVLFMDTIAVLLILLSISGLYIWLRYANAKR